METQGGARAALVDPFGRDIEAWLDDVPSPRMPYVSDLVVATPESESASDPADALADDAPVSEADDAAVDEAAVSDAAEPVGVGALTATDVPATADLAATEEPAADSAPDSFRRNHGRHRSACAPSFPEPPERLALRIGELAVLVSATTGRPTLERIEVLEEQLRVRDADLARFTAWEAALPSDADPEVAAARAFARALFADIIAGAAARSVSRAMPDEADPAVHAIIGVDDVRDAIPSPFVDAVRLERPAAPVSANTRPAPLVLPATGPNAIDRLAVRDAIRGHAPEQADAGATGSSERLVRSSSAVVDGPSAATEGRLPSTSWWRRIITALLRPLRRA